MAAYQYVYVMQNLTKVFPGKELFKGITLSFCRGLKLAFSVSMARVNLPC